MVRQYAVWVLIFLAASGVESCFRKSASPEPTPAAKKEVIEEIQAQTASVTNAARSTNERSDVSTAELKRLSEELFSLDVNNVGSRVRVNVQGRTSSSATNDVASLPLFVASGNTHLQGDTIKAYKALFDNYIENTSSKDISTAHEKREEGIFLDKVMATSVMKRTEKFLKSKNLIRTPLRSALNQIWFTPYSRSRGQVGSSGFEHVFLGELKNGAVSGLHNWIFFQKEENEGDIDYKGHIKTLSLGNKGKIMKLRFDWMNKSKSVGSMFVGTSPELELALYTICFYTRQNKGCNIQMNNKKFRIKVYGFNYKGKTYIGSAFPDIF